ncbi:acetyl esterase/lipase [Thermocatellispora tengchongensis]|uniref:Acetyl esterase/lipase n=1 Tax=Thermocatellispora tengchongensis TaxID=1073253 RepID=A0A840PF42_9ACTN|nr:alpha/beta hydrolase [Thermocatellispora tengchongensis]MBB5136080.1 acetyl esterase/lipase [Thermocatellispora tengchongensis]
MASQEADALRSMYQSLSERSAARPDMDLAAMRTLFEELHRVTPEPEGVSYAEVDAGGTPAIWCLPDGRADDRVLIHHHGGGFMVCSMYTDRKMAGHIAKAAGTRALVLDFPLAPENPFPAQINASVAAFRWLLDQGFEPAHIASVGHSAGGNLCTGMALALREAGDPMPAAVMPMSPWYDMELTGETFDTLAHLDAVVQRPILETMRAAFLGATPPDTPLANPLYADLRGFPPTLIYTGAHETLVSDTERFVKNARDAGVDAHCEIVPEMQHSFAFLAGRAPEADAAIRRMAAWLRVHLGL